MIYVPFSPNMRRSEISSAAFSSVRDGRYNRDFWGDDGNKERMSSIGKVGTPTSSYRARGGGMSVPSQSWHFFGSLDNAAAIGTMRIPQRTTSNPRASDLLSIFVSLSAREAANVNSTERKTRGLDRIVVLCSFIR